MDSGAPNGTPDFLILFFRFFREFFGRISIAKCFGIFHLAGRTINIRPQPAHTENDAAEAAVSRIDSETGNAICFQHIDFQLIAHILCPAVAKKNRLFQFSFSILRPALQEIIGQIFTPGKFFQFYSSLGFFI